MGEQPNPTRTTITAGLVYRSHIKQLLFQLGLEFWEEKRLLDSVFYVEGQPELIDKFNQFCARIEDEQRAQKLEKELKEYERKARWRWYNPFTWWG